MAEGVSKSARQPPLSLDAVHAHVPMRERRLRLGKDISLSVKRGQAPGVPWSDPTDSLRLMDAAGR